MVLIGDPSYPANIIIMKDGTEFYDELNSPKWAFETNQEVFRNKGQSDLKMIGEEVEV